MSYQHSSLVQGRWATFSLCEQLGNVGSEVGRAARARGKKDEQQVWRAADRAFELLDMTIDDARWRLRLKELVRAREVFADAILGGKEYGATLDDMEAYFFPFAFAARTHPSHGPLI